jgi:small subunit ribosomal protein S4
VTVNGQKVNIPSYQVKDGDVIEVRTSSLKMPMVMQAIESVEREVPEYIQVDHKAGKATFLRVPELADVPFAVEMEPHLIVEFYSR